MGVVNGLRALFKVGEQVCQAIQIVLDAPGLLFRVMLLALISSMLDVGVSDDTICMLFMVDAS